MELREHTKEYALYKTTNNAHVEFEIKFYSDSRNNGFHQNSYRNRLDAILRNSYVQHILYQAIQGDKEFFFKYADLHTLQPKEKLKKSLCGIALPDLFRDEKSNAISCNYTNMIWRIRPASNGGLYFVQDVTFDSNDEIICSIDNYSTKVIRINKNNIEIIENILKRLQE